MKRRLKIRIGSFAVTLFAVFIVWGVTQTVMANNYETLVQISRQRALDQICEYLDNIETDLAKTQYATSGTMLSNLSTNLLREASGAKTSLSSLQAGEVGLYNIYKFLSQVGEYTASLSRKAANSEEISEKDREILASLLQYAASLSTQFDLMSELNNNGYFSFEQLNENLLQTDESSEEMVNFMSAVSDAEQSMSDYPTLIYDGPYSDSVLNSVSELLENENEVSLEEAKKTASKTLGVDEKLLISDGEVGGRIATYDFHCEKVFVSISKKGGYPVYILSDAVVGETKISEKDALEKAEDFLEDIGYSNMEPTYYYTTDGVCTINFAFEDEEYTCYSDLIKLSISLYDGKVTSMDAVDYLMNHIDREIPEEKITKQQAISTVSSVLRVKEISLAVIPTSSGSEKYTYEILCEGEDGQDILVYIDTQTGEEADILLLLYSDNGTLTK